jgi:hypothetical protein
VDHRKSAASQQLNSLTPERVIRQCGQPLSDEIHNAGQTVFRELSYKTSALATDDRFTVKFMGTKGERLYFLDVNTDDNTAKTSEQKTRWFNCLAK